MNINKEINIEINSNGFYFNLFRFVLLFGLSIIIALIDISININEYHTGTEYFWFRFVQQVISCVVVWRSGTYLKYAWDVRPWKKIIDKSEQ